MVIAREYRDLKSGPACLVQSYVQSISKVYVERGKAECALMVEGSFKFWLFEV